jgi:hypothetical protein
LSKFGVKNGRQAYAVAVRIVIAAQISRGVVTARPNIFKHHKYSALLHRDIS